MYYLTVTTNAIEVVRPQPFIDYSAAIEFLNNYYQPRVQGSRVTLSFVTEVVNGMFARSFGSLTRPENIGNPANDPQYPESAKQSLAFQYNRNYNFLIETEYGIQDLEEMMEKYADEE